MSRPPVIVGRGIGVSAPDIASPRRGRRGFGGGPNASPHLNVHRQGGGAGGVGLTPGRNGEWADDSGLPPLSVGRCRCAAAACSTPVRGWGRPVTRSRARVRPTRAFYGDFWVWGRLTVCRPEAALTAV